MTTMTRWNMMSEYAFLDRLGSYAPDVSERKTRRQLLAGYIQGVDKRTAGFSPHEMSLLRERAQMMLMDFNERMA